MNQQKEDFIDSLGFPKLPKVVLPKKQYSLYRKKRKEGIEGGNVYVWNSTSVADIPDKCEVCSFYVEDTRFNRLINNAKKATTLLGGFDYVIQPDYSVYYDLELIDQIYRTWVGKNIARIWTDNGIKIIPNLVLGSKELFDYAIYGIEEGSSFAVQIQATDQTEQDLVDAWTIKKAIKKIKPKTVLVHGTDDRLRKLGLDNMECIVRIESYITRLRDEFNTKVA